MVSDETSDDDFQRQSDDLLQARAAAAARGEEYTPDLALEPETTPSSPPPSEPATESQAPTIIMGPSAGG